MHLSGLSSACALIVTCSAVNAAPSEIGAGTGTWAIDGTHNHSFYVDLGPGTYSFTSVVGSAAANALDQVYFSTSPLGGGGTQIPFTQVNNREDTGSVAAITLTAPQSVYVDVVADRKGPQHTGMYAGYFQVSAVPEPANAALLLGGLGVLGLMGYRRRRQQR